MIKVEGIRRLEELSAELGISSAMLMERAGKSLYDYLDKHLELKTKTTIIFAGHGNNAGDSFALARHLCKDSFVFVFLYGDSSKFTGATASAFAKIANNDHIDIFRPNQLDDHTIKKIRKTDHLLLIDALFGIGLKGEIRNRFTEAVDLFNSFTGYKVSIDIPSGIDASSGEVGSFFCKPDLTLTFYDKKPGLMGLKRVVVVPLAFAPEAVSRYNQEQTRRNPLK